MLSVPFTFRILASLRSAPRSLTPRLSTWETGCGSHGGAGGVPRRGGWPSTSRTMEDRDSPRAARLRGATMAKATETRSASTARAASGKARSAAETEKIRVALVERRDELQTEYDRTLSEITELQ